MSVIVVFESNSKGKPPAYAPLAHNGRRKLADCELRFVEGPLAGYKLQGFCIWERVVATNTLPLGNLSVTPPDYADPRPNVKGSHSLLRPIEDYSFSHLNLRGQLKNFILDEFKKWRERAEKNQ